MVVTSNRHISLIGLLVGSCLVSLSSNDQTLGAIRSLTYSSSPLEVTPGGDESTVLSFTESLSLFLTSRIPTFQTEGGRPSQIGHNQNKNIAESGNYYKPSDSEQYVIDHALELGYRETDLNKVTSVCPLWEPGKTPVSDSLTKYRAELSHYTKLVQNITFSSPSQTRNIGDLRKQLRKGGSYDEVCRQVRLHPEGLHAIFDSHQLSYSSKFGYIEPLLPPLRHPDFCADPNVALRNSHILNLNYLVHDFESMCRHLKPHSRNVLIDMGASLMFHGQTDSPALYLTKMYRTFGFPFDHIYAFEVSPQDPTSVFKKVPHELFPSYHWINVGVNPDENDAMNPFTMLLEEYTEDDFVVIKLDIDTNVIENKLAIQLLNDVRLHRIVDQFYFEHHVMLKELLRSWGSAVDRNASVFTSMNLFQEMRKKGIAAHYWV